jgi:hypothetical protein
MNWHPPRQFELLDGIDGGAACQFLLLLLNPPKRAP